MQYKKQHWIPQSYLQAWCDPDVPAGQNEYAWIFSVNGTDVRKKNPKNIFYESEIYTIHLCNGERILDIEHGLSGLEDLFANVRRNVLYERKSLTLKDRTIIMSFIAATFSRTRARRDHLKREWGKVLDLGMKLKEGMKNATPEQRKTMALLGSLSSKDESFTLDEVQRLADKPLQETLINAIKTQTELLMPMNISFLCTEDDIGYITSDDPCVWFDPEAYKRPAFYRSPGLAYKTIEITLPISPNMMALLSWRPMSLYINVPNDIVDDLNRRTRFYADEYFVVRRNFTKKIWFDPGKPPEGWVK